MCPLCFIRRGHPHEENHRDPAAAHSRADAHRLRRPHPRRAPEDLARGTWDGNTFVSEFDELTLTLPESGWTISTDEEIADQMGISRELLDSTELEDAIMEQTNITDMMAVDSATDDLLALFHD